MSNYRKIPWRLSRFQKARQRERLRAVDAVVDTLDKALARQGETLKALETWKAEMPTEAEMLPRDKYTMFDRKEKKYRKGIHSMFGISLPSFFYCLLCGERSTADGTKGEAGCCCPVLGKRRKVWTKGCCGQGCDGTEMTKLTIIFLQSCQSGQGCHKE